MNVCGEGVRRDRSGQRRLPLLSPDRVGRPHNRGDDVAIDVAPITTCSSTRGEGERVGSRGPVGKQVIVQPGRHVDLDDTCLGLRVAEWITARAKSRSPRFSSHTSLLRSLAQPRAARIARRGLTCRSLRCRPASQIAVLWATRGWAPISFQVMLFWRMRRVSSARARVSFETGSWIADAASMSASSSSASTKFPLRFGTPSIYSAWLGDESRQRVG